MEAGAEAIRVPSSADVVDLAAIIEGIELAADLHNGVGGSLSANRGEEVGAVNLGSRIA